MHAIAAQIEISKVDAKIDRQTGKKIVCGFLKPGEKGVCQIKVYLCSFRLKDQYVWKNTISCRVWDDSPLETKESKTVFI